MWCLGLKLPLPEDTLKLPLPFLLLEILCILSTIHHSRPLQVRVGGGGEGEREKERDERGERDPILLIVVHMYYNLYVH